MTDKKPKALQEVWEWEEKVYQKTKNMNLTEYVEYVREESKKILASGNQIEKKAQIVQTR